MNNQLKSYAIIALMSSGVTLGAYSLFNLGNSSGLSDAPSAFTSSVSNQNVPGNPGEFTYACLLYTSPSPRDRTRSRMPSSA